MSKDKRTACAAPWRPQLLMGNASLSRMLADWIRDKRFISRRARARESKGRWARV